jgi:hypothetical protein
LGRLPRHIAMCAVPLTTFFLWMPHTTHAEALHGKPLSYDITDNVKLELPGYYRFRFTHLDSMDISKIPSGQRAGETQSLESIDYSEHRFRIEPSVSFSKKLSFHSQVDILTGMLSGDTAGRIYQWYAEPEQRWNAIDGGSTHNFQNLHFKRYYGAWETPIGLLQVGRQGSHWGLGMLANDGEGFKNDFGDAYYGDNVDRVLFGTKPYSIFRSLVSGEKPEKDPLTVAFAYDWHVARDPNMKRGKEKIEAATGAPFEGVNGDLDDKVHQYIGALLVETEPFEGGFYIVRRIMEHPDILLPIDFQPPGGEYLRVWVFDVYGRLHIKPRFLDGGELFLEGELARITGKTNLTVSQSFQSPENPFPESDVSQLGWVIRGGIRRSPLEGRIEVGYASGDSNPFDTDVKGFKFHPDYNVGMILFEDLLAQVSAASTYNAIKKFGEAGPIPPLGADLLPTNGAVTNAVYIAPTFKIAPYENLECALTLLYARAATDVVDPAIDGLFGGGAGMYNSLGGPAGNRYLGTEIDLGISYTFKWDYIDSVVGLQYGHLFPGSVFEDTNGNRMADIDKVQFRLTFLW